MKLILKVESTDERHEIDPNTLSYEEIEAVEDQVDMTWGEFGVAMNRLSIKSLRVLLWLARRRLDARLAYKNSELDPATFDFEAELTEEEKRQKEEREAKEQATPNRQQRRHPTPAASA